MTTPDTTTAKDWLEDLVPLEVREEGDRLLAELAEWRKAAEPLLRRIGAHLALAEKIDERADAQLSRALRNGDLKLIGDVTDATGSIIGVLTRAVELNAALSNMGVDPDELAGMALAGVTRDA